MNALALIATTQSLIAAGDIAGAESALVALADAEGDAALMLVLEQLPAKDLLAVVREYDSSRESVVNLLVSPAQFARAVVLEKLYKDLSHTHLRGMVNSIVFRSEADPVEFLEAIGELEGGAEALADYFAEKWASIEAFARSGTFDAFADPDAPLLTEAQLRDNAYLQPITEQDEVADQDWMELSWLLRYQLPDVFIEMLQALRTKARAYGSGVEEEETLEPGLDSEDDAQTGKFNLADTDTGKATPATRNPDEEQAI